MTRLAQIEKEHSVEILYAIESGSRAWGFESQDSDYDVRFIYRHSKNWYLNILPKRDVIEYPIIDLYDYSGWDLRKSLFLMNKSNPVLFEWLASPIVYIKKEKEYSLLKDASEKYFSPISTIYHYLHMAEGNNRQFLNGNEVKIKKYFYVLRPLFACMWIDKFSESPPLHFETLMEKLDLDHKLVDKVYELLKRKKAGVELGIEPKIHDINLFIDEKLEHFRKFASSYNPSDKPSASYLDEIFIKLLST